MQPARLAFGSTILVIGLLSPLLIPLVLASSWSASTKSILTGLLAFGIPEVLMLLAVAIMGKDGYAFIKAKFLKNLKRYGPPDEVSLFRYRIGLVFFVVPVLFGILQPYLGHFFETFQTIPFWWHMSLDMMFVISFFILGGDFWDKFRSMFHHDLKIVKS